MADERNLGVRITLTDSATPAIASLNAELQRLSDVQRILSSTSSAFAADAAKSIAAIVQQTEAIRGQIQALQAQQNAFGAAAAAAREMRLDTALGPATERQISSAAASARTLATSLSAAAASDALLRDQMLAGSAVQTATAAQFRTMVEELTGIRTSFMSAAESAAVFERELGAVGGSVTVVAGRGIQELIRDNTMLSRSFKSAAESAAVFRAALPELGAGITLTPAAGFSRMVADLAGVKTSLLSARESAAVFSAGLESGAVNAQAGTAGVSREIRHVVAGFDELARGQRGAFFSTLGAAARDAGFGVGALVGSMGGLIAVFGVGAIVRGEESLAKWAETSMAAASATGLTVNQVTRLDSSMVLLGAKAGQTDGALRGFARSLAQALADPASKAAQAFHALGITQDELVAHSKTTYDALLFFADAWNRVNESESKAAAGEIIARGQLERLLPILNRGSDGITQLGDKVDKLGHTLNDQTAPAAAKTGEAISAASEKLSGAWNKALIASEPIIEKAIDLLGRLGGAFGSVAQQISNIKPLPETISFLRLPFSRIPGLDTNVSSLTSSAIAGAGIGAGAGASQARTPGGINAGPITGAATTAQSNELELAQASAAAWAKAKDTATGRIAAENAIIGVLEKQLTAAKAVAASQNASEESRKEVVRIETQLARERQSLSETTLSQGATATRKSYEDFVAGEREKVAEAGKDVAAIAAIYDEWLAEAKRLYGEDSKQYKIAEREKVLAAEAAGRERIRIINQGASDTARMQEAQALQARLVAIQGGAQPGQLADPGTVIAAGQQAAQQILATGWKEIYDLQVEAAKDGASGAVEAQDDANRRILSTWNETVQKLIENYDKITAYAKRSAEESSRAYVQFFDRVGSQVDTFGKSLLDALVAPHTETILEGIQYRTVSLRTQEIRQAFGKLVEGMSSDLFNALTSAISQAIAQSLVKNIFTNITLQPGEGIGALFGKAVGGLFSNQAQAPSVASMGLSSTDIQGFSNALKQGTSTATTNLGNFNDALVKSTMALRNQVASAGGGGGGSSGTGTVQQAIQESSDKATANDNTQTLATVGAIAGLGSLLGSAIGGSAGRIITGITGVLELVVNLLFLLNAKPSILGFSYAGGGVVPSAAGGWRVPSAAGGMVTAGRSDGILSILHPNEMVLPANISQAVQNMASGGSGGGGSNFAVTFQVQALDAQGVNAFFKNNGPALAAAFANQVRANNPNIMRTAKGFA